MKKELFSYLLLILGCALFSMGDVMLVNPYMLAPGGTYGLSNVFSSLWGGKISVYAISMDIPLLLIGTWLLGARFGLKTVVSTLLIFGFTFLLETKWGYLPLIHDGEVLTVPPADMTGYVALESHGLWFRPDYILNTVVAGLVYGVSIGLIFRSGATSGGSDIVSMVIHKYSHISLGTLVIIVNGIITLSTLVAFGDIRLPIYSIIIIYIEGQVVDMVVDGMKSCKTVLIITDQVEPLCAFIHDELKRSGTIFVGKGIYRGVEHQMLYLALNRADMVKLRAKLPELAPEAFINILDSSEIIGKKFKSLT